MKKFYIYRNLRTGGFSVRYDGKVIKRIDAAIIHNATFKVNEGGRQDTIKRKQKTVHAFIVTNSIDFSLKEGGNVEEVTYNPYQNSAFMLGDEPIESAEKVFLAGGRCFVPSALCDVGVDGVATSYTPRSISIIDGPVNG